MSSGFGLVSLWGWWVSSEWVSVPRRAPGRCRATGFADASEGPFFEEAKPFYEVPGDDRELTGYLSARYVADVCAAPGSPFRLVEVGEAEARDRFVADLVAENARLVGVADELRVEVEALRGRVGRPVDHVSLADLVAERMESRFALKAGRKRAA